MIYCPIVYEDQLLYALLDAPPDEPIRVWIEQPLGTFYARFYHDAPYGLVRPNEFIARTWDDPLGAMSRAMLGTGWFERTGDEISYPTDEFNEIWRLSELGIELLASCGDEIGDAMADPALQAFLASLVEPQS